MKWLYTIWDATKGGMEELVKSYIINGDYDVNQKRIGDLMTPLHVAVINRRVELTKKLLNFGADFNLKDKDGKTPADHLTKKGDKLASSIRRLIRNFISAKERKKRGEEIKSNPATSSDGL